MTIDLSARPVTFHGSALARLALRLVGWRVVFDGFPSRQGVMVVYPHTSNWDFIVGLLGKWAMGIQVHFWGKASLFTPPLLGPFMRYVGGVPVDRGSSRGVVGDTVQAIEAARQRDEMWWLVLAPEGTRSLRDGWRSGFYHVALRAKVPLGLAFIDYATRTVGCDTFIELTGDESADMARVAAAMSHRVGRHPGLASPIRMDRRPGSPS